MGKVTTPTLTGKTHRRMSRVCRGDPAWFICIEVEKSCNIRDIETVTFEGGQKSTFSSRCRLMAMSPEHAAQRRIISARGSRITPSVTIGLDADVGHHGVRCISPIAFSQRGSQSTATHAAAMCGYCGASARIKFDDERFAAVFDELKAAATRQS